MNTTTRLIVVALLLTACGDATATTTSVTPLPDVTTTTAAPSPGGFVVGTPSLFPPDPLPGSDGASGSGCTPGEGALPDGAWFGLVGRHDTTGFDFDLACFFFGDVAEQKAADEGGEAPGGFYVSNQNPALRRVDVDPATPVHWIVAPPDAELGFAAAAYAEWVDDPAGYSNCPGEFCAVWLFVNGGVATEVLEQYIP